MQGDAPWIPHGERAKEYETEESLPVARCKDCKGEVYYEQGEWWPAGCEPLIVEKTRKGSL